MAVAASSGAPGCGGIGYPRDCGTRTEAVVSGAWVPRFAMLSQGCYPNKCKLPSIDENFHGAVAPLLKLETLRRCQSAVSHGFSIQRAHASQLQFGWTAADPSSLCCLSWSRIPLM